MSESLPHSASNSKTVNAVQVIYHGQVQGVGFRASTAAIADQFPVAGYVQNRPDGTVELIAQGSDSALDEFLAAIARRFGNLITNHSVTPVSINEPLPGFQIRR